MDVHRLIIFHIVVGLLSRCHPAAGEDYFYTYFKQRRDLTVDTTRIAIEATLTPDESTIAQIVEEHGGVFVQLRDLGIASWHFVDVQAFDPAIVVAIAADLPNEPFVSFASPVFLTARGWLVPTKTILLQTVAENAVNHRMGELLAWAPLENGFIYPSNYATGMGVLEAANELAMDPGIQFAEPNMIFSGGNAFIPNDDGFPNCWGIHNTGQFGGVPDVDMDGPEAWDTTLGDPEVIVVVIDTGVQQDHPDIHQIPGADFTGEGGGGAPINTFDRHGTAVAGTVSAIANNVSGTVGIAPGCVTASARTFISTNAQGEWVSEAEWTVDALDWAQTIGARVTNNSNFYGFESSAIAQKYAEGQAAGVVHFASPGNASQPVLEYPASLPSVLATGAITNSGALASYSSFGADLDFVAPGSSIYTTDRTANEGYILGAYVFLDGTSFSSSYAAGVAALFVSTHPSASAVTVEEAMKRTAVNLGAAGTDDTFGWGLVNAANAVAWDPECGETPPPHVELSLAPKNRYLTFQPGTGNRIAAILVTVDSVSIPGWQEIQGQSWWVAAPYSTDASSAGPVTLARLSCQPVFHDWSDVNWIHVIDPVIIPAARYSLRSLYQACYSPPAMALSASFNIPTAFWADIVDPFNPPSQTAQPDFMDISAVVDRFRGLTSAPDLTYTDLEPDIPNQDVNFSDISAAVNSFRGLGYPFLPPCTCENPCP